MADTGILNSRDPNAREFVRLFKFARKLGADTDFAMELAADAFASGIAAGVPEWHYMSVCLKHAFLMIKRDRRRRNLDYQWTFVKGESEPMEMRRLVTPASQFPHLELAEVLGIIQSLNDPYRTAMSLAAREYTADEIAAEMGAKKKDVYWWLQYARKILRAKLGDGEPVKRGHKKFHGIRKDHHRWVAAFRRGRNYYHCGYHPDAESAAMAYDAKASEILGAAAKLNFPQGGEVR